MQSPIAQELSLADDFVIRRDLEGAFPRLQQATAVRLTGADVQRLPPVLRHLTHLEVLEVAYSSVPTGERFQTENEF